MKYIYELRMATTTEHSKELYMLAVLATHKNHITLSVSYYPHIKMNCCVLNTNKI